VVVTRSDVQHVVTEFGAVNLFGKSLQERAMAMISIAHPKFRDELFSQAKKMGLLSVERTLHESIHGVYPIHLEEVIEIEGEVVTIRPAKPVDDRRIQEHFYSLDKDDVVARFFKEKSRFTREEAQGVTQVDYVNDLTVLALVGEFGFGRVVGVGEYLVESDTHEAEVAFSISKEFQKKGIGKLLLHKLASAARANGIRGFFAYTAAHNQGMIRLFGSLPYKTNTHFEGDMVTLRCSFSEPLAK
jgi:GNAT superfamily N-acetyltransferase